MKDGIEAAPYTASPEVYSSLVWDAGCGPLLHLPVMDGAAPAYTVDEYDGPSFLCGHGGLEDRAVKIPAPSTMAPLVRARDVEHGRVQWQAIAVPICGACAARWLEAARAAAVVEAEAAAAAEYDYQTREGL